MTYTLSGIAAYLVLGAILTYSVFREMRRPRRRFRDFALGSVLMPILLVLLLLFILFEKLWARLLIVLDFDPPEDMRAGPAEPASKESGSKDAP